MSPLHAKFSIEGKIEHKPSFTTIPNNDDTKGARSSASGNNYNPKKSIEQSFPIVYDIL